MKILQKAEVSFWKSFIKIKILGPQKYQLKVIKKKLKSIKSTLYEFEDSNLYIERTKIFANSFLISQYPENIHHRPAKPPISNYITFIITVKMLVETYTSNRRKRAFHII